MDIHAIKNPCLGRLPSWTSRGRFGRPAGRTLQTGRPADPLLKAPECQLVGPDEARIVEASAFGNYGERVKLIRGEEGGVVAVQIAQEGWVLEADLQRELIKLRYGFVSALA